MALKWIHESPAKWDEGKQAVVGEAPAGIFDRRYAELAPGDLVPGEWWRVEDSGVVVGYGVASSGYRSRDASPWTLAAAFPVMHMAWGAGFIRTVLGRILGGRQR